VVTPTGCQRSGATPLYAATTTNPAGPLSMGKVVKKNLPAIVAAHGADYVATASVGYPKDLQRKVKKAMGFSGSRCIQIDSPCPSVWGFPSDMTMEMGRLGVRTGLVPIFEMEYGKFSGVQKIAKRVPVREYLKGQGRFRHIVGGNGAQEELDRIQRVADENIEYYGLV
jgi:pyruvate ferredoxin oxidoreductase beta subunit